MPKFLTLGDSFISIHMRENEPFYQVNDIGKYIGIPTLSVDEEDLTEGGEKILLGKQSYANKTAIENRLLRVRKRNSTEKAKDMILRLNGSPPDTKKEAALKNPDPRSINKVLDHNIEIQKRLIEINERIADLKEEYEQLKNQLKDH